MYDSTKERISYRYFKFDFLLTVAILLIISMTVWFASFAIEARHHSIASNNATNTTLQNNFWQTMDGQKSAPVNSSLANFVAATNHDLTIAREGNPHLSSLPTSITEAHTENNIFGNLAWNSRTYIWGVNSNGSGDVDPQSYNEGGKYSSTYLNDLTIITFGTLAEVTALTHKIIIPPGNTIPPITLIMWILWFLVVGSLGYVFAAFDHNKKEGYSTFFSIVRSPDASKFSRILFTIITPVPMSFLWYGYLSEKHSMDRESAAILKRAMAPENPLAEELKNAQAILDKYKNSKHANLPEVQGVVKTAQMTKDSILYAARHQTENAVRKEAINDLETLAPIAEASAEFHADLHKDMQEFADTRVGDIHERIKKAFAGGSVQLGTTTSNVNSTANSPTSTSPTVIKPELVNDVDEDEY